MAGQQSTPTMSKTGQLTSCQRHQRPVIGAACQLVEHVEPLPHCLPEHLAQNLVHLADLLPSSSVPTCPHRNALDIKWSPGPGCAISTYKAWAWI
jgi:hypothetical protein